MKRKLYSSIIYFLIYSFTGWIIETIYMSISLGHLVKRGFLIGPFCIVYGFSALALVYILYRVKRHITLVFILGSLISTIAELLAGLLLKYAFHIRLWNYSQQPFNFKGIMCLRNSILWGILAVMIIYIIHPTLVQIIEYLSYKSIYTIYCFALLILCTDATISIYAASIGQSNVSVAYSVYLDKVMEFGELTIRLFRFIW